MTVERSSWLCTRFASISIARNEQFLSDMKPQPRHFVSNMQFCDGLTFKQQWRKFLLRYRKFSFFTMSDESSILHVTRLFDKIQNCFCRLFNDILHLYNFYHCTDENLEISTSTGTNQFRVSSNLCGIDQLIRVVPQTQTVRRNKYPDTET